MRYIVPKLNCVLFNKESMKLNKDVQYKCDFVDNSNLILFGLNKELPFAFNFEETSSVETVKYKNDEYYFLFGNNIQAGNTVQIKYQNKLVSLSISGNLIITIEGKLILDEQVEEISYSHFEIVNQHLLIYFKGKRNFIVVLKDLDLKCATYYDEINVKDGEYFFMCRLFDSLNHGKVFHLKDKVYEDYLVYLDDNDLNLKKEFTGCVFLDCVLAGNLNYANNLLIEELQQKNKENILKFFPNFDWFFPLEENVYFLFKKNTLAGIYKFEIKDNLICNIIQQELWLCLSNQTILLKFHAVASMLGTRQLGIIYL